MIKNMDYSEIPGAPVPSLTRQSMTFEEKVRSTWELQTSSKIHKGEPEWELQE